MTGDASDQAVFLIVVALRLIVPLAIPRFPLPAIVASMLIDASDLNIFELFTDLDLSGYQGYDKALDVYYLTVAYLSTFRNWTSVAAFEAGRFLIYVRLAGVILFEVTGAREFLLLFPNTFEYFFVFYEIVALRWSPTRMSRQVVYAAAATIWVVIKLPQEYWIHVAQLDVTDELSSHPAVVPVIAGALTLLVTVAWWIMVRHVPPPDRQLSVTGPREEPTEPTTRMQSAGRLVRRVIQRSLVEKLILVAMVCVIFAQVLPNVRSETMELVFGVAVIIYANTVISEWLAHRGVGWSTTFSQFIAMGSVNTALATSFYILLPLGDGFIHVGNTLFFLLLLTLLVVMYDRYQPYYAARVNAGEKREQDGPRPLSRLTLRNG